MYFSRRIFWNFLRQLTLKLKHFSNFLFTVENSFFFLRRQKPRETESFSHFEAAPTRRRFSALCSLCLLPRRTLHFLSNFLTDTNISWWRLVDTTDRDTVVQLLPQERCTELGWVNSFYRISRVLFTKRCFSSSVLVAEDKVRLSVVWSKNENKKWRRK